MREETGLTAKRWELILRMHLSNSVTDEEAFIYVAEELEQGEYELEETEADLVVKKLPLREAVQMVMNGEITDSISVAGLLKLAKLRNL